MAYGWMTEADLEELGANQEHFDGLINYLRNIEGVDVGIMFRENGQGTTKVSLRARAPFNCAQFLKQFGGGGHAAAAGATLHMPLKAAREAVLDRIADFPPFNNTKVVS